VSKCILGLSVVLIFNAQSSDSKIQETWLVFMSLCLLMILQNTGFNIKETLNLSLLNCAMGEWNEKHHTFWLVLFFWPIFYSIKHFLNYKKLITILFFLFALASSYSESAKLAILVSFIIFIFSKIDPTKTWNATYRFMLAYILLFPFIFQIISFTEMEFLYDRIYDRFAFFETASNVIVDNLFFGSGFGSSLSLDVSPYIPSIVQFNRIGTELPDGTINFAGGHPHNFVALIWIEFGLIGALMITFFIYKFNKFVFHTIKHSDAAPYIISIIIVASVLFSCSWSIWQTDVVLTYIMFLACLCFLITTGNYNKDNSFNALE
jgi:O-antigen ligase